MTTNLTHTDVDGTHAYMFFSFEEDIDLIELSITHTHSSTEMQVHVQTVAVCRTYSLADNPTHEEHDQGNDLT